MNLTLLHLHTPSIAALGELSLSTKTPYAAKWGLGLHAYTHSLDYCRPASWSKVLACRMALERGVDWVWWLDADAAITNPDIDVRGLCDTDYDFLVGADFNGFNAGSFLMRNSAESLRFLNAVWNRTDCMNHCWWEQKAMMEVLAATPDICRVKYIDKRLINSYPDDWQPGDLVFHCPGGRHDRIDMIQERLSRPIGISTPQLRPQSAIP